jgi:hypothetical protein
MYNSVIIRTIAASTLAALIACSPQASAQRSSDIMAQLSGSAEEVEDTRETLVRKNMGLTATEADAFWPVYRDYRRAMGKNTKRAVKWITDYADAYNTGGVDAETMRNLLDDYFGYQKRVADVRSRFVSRFSEALPAPKVLRFYQVEHRIDLWVQSNLAEQIPLAE